MAEVDQYAAWLMRSQSGGHGRKPEAQAPKQLQPFHADCKFVLREPGYVAAGSRETGDKTGTYWIGDLREYDGNIGGRLLQRDQGYRRTGEDHVRLESNQLRSLSPQALGVATGPTSLDAKVFARHPAELLEPLTECIDAIASFRIVLGNSE
jgi:hypothetical protein